MRPLSEYRNDYYVATGQASDVARQLSFAGIALIWIFKVDVSGAVSIPKQLYLPAMFFVLAFAFDLLQYMFKAAIWGTFARYHEWKGKKPEEPVVAPAWANYPALVCFWGKIGFVIFGYVELFEYTSALLR